jgi:hypothetical protein
MDRFLNLILSGVLFAASAHGDLMLTPRIVAIEKEGGSSKHFAFSDGAETITYQPPRGWDYSGSATELTLRPPNKAPAKATITRIPLLHPGSFDDDCEKELVDEAIALLPQGSEEVSVLSQEKNLMMIQGKETFLIVLSYTYYGDRYSRSILLLNRRDEQLRFQLTCRESDFTELHRAFFASHGTWQHL